MTSSEHAQLVQFLGERFAAIDQRFAAIDQRFAAIDQRFAAIDQRFAAIEGRFDDLRAEILGHFDELYRRLERLEQEYQAILHGLRRIETMLADERRRREILERDLAALREHAVVLQARIDALERRLQS